MGNYKEEDSFFAAWKNFGTSDGLKIWPPVGYMYPYLQRNRKKIAVSAV